MPRIPWVSASLTWRLSLLFAGVSLAILTATGVFLHHALAQQLMLRDAQDLNGKIELVRHTLRKVDSTADIARSRSRWLELVIGHAGLYLGIFDDRRNPILTSFELAVPDQVFKTAASETESRADIVEWTDGAGKAYRAVSAWGTFGKVEGQRVLIALALDISGERQLLDEYQMSIAGAVVAGTLLAAMLGIWATRRGLTPLQQLAAAADRTTASRLDERLDIGATPEELRTIASAYNAMLNRLQDSFSRLSQFSSDLAHDLRTPVGNLLGEAQVALSRDRTVDEYREIIVSSVEELERIARMIESMLFLARADNAQLALRPEIIPLDSELDRIRQYFEPLAHEKALLLEVMGNETVYADPTLLRRAVSNLVANAIRFTPHADRSITIASRRTPDGGTEIRVNNPGPEVAPQDRQRIFERFHRLGPGRQESSSGSGLGLAIVKSIVELHGGRAWVESASGTNTFVLWFPRAQSHRQGMSNS